MDRRTATGWIASMMLVGCGGGGGGSAAPADSTAGTTGSGGAPAAAPATAAALPPPTTRNVALWGDSMTPPTARALALTYQGQREVFDGGVPGETSAQISARQAADTAHRDWITVFWYGHNDVRIDASTAAAQVKAELAASIARLTPGNDRFVVLSLANNAADARRGSAQYDAVIALNNELATLYAGNYLDIRSFMVAQYDPNDPRQVEDYQADVPSSALRFDDIHLTGEGARIVGERIAEYIASRGW